jgi:hypothetical protein
MAFLGIAAFIAYAVTVICAAYAGLNLVLVGWLTVLAIFACLFTRFTLPLTVAAFFGAWKAWEWHPVLALLFVAPGLVLVVPSVLAHIVAGTIGAFRGRRVV